MLTKPHKKFLLIILAGCAALLVALMLATPGEPTHNGRPLRSWLADLDNNTNYQRRLDAKAAIQAMGPAALPYLTNSLAQRDSATLRIYRSGWIPNSVVNWLRPRVQWHQPVMESWHASIALGSLGPDAKDATPALAAALGDVSDLVAQSAAQALAKIGAPAVPAIRERLAKGGTQEKIYALRALSNMGTNGLAAARDVAPLLTESMPLLADTASVALSQFGPEAAPFAANYFTHTNSRVRMRAVSAVLYPFGSAPFLTNALLPLLHDPDPKLRYNARAALRRANPPPEFFTPILLEGLNDPDPRNVEMSLNLLVTDPENVAQYNREIAALAARPEKAIRQIASDALASYNAWPVK